MPSLGTCHHCGSGLAVISGYEKDRSGQFLRGPDGAFVYSSKVRCGNCGCVAEGHPYQKVIDAAAAKRKADEEAKLAARAIADKTSIGPQLEVMGAPQNYHCPTTSPTAP